MKSLFSLVRLVPIAVGDARSCDPDLANALRRTRSQRIRIDDDYLLLQHRAAAANQLLRLFVRGVCDEIQLERWGVH